MLNRLFMVKSTYQRSGKVEIIKKKNQQKFITYSFILSVLLL